MSDIKVGEINVADHDDAACKAWVKPASQASINVVLAADPRSDNGRSPFVWIRFSNGDLVLATFPQGDTYFETEEDHSS